MLNTASSVDLAGAIVPALHAPLLLRAEREFRKVPLSRGKHHGGRISLGTDHSMIRVESHEEAQVARVFAARADFSHLTSQPVTVWFRWNGRMHRYTPDFEIWLRRPAVATASASRRGHLLVEVKPMGWIMRDAPLWSARAAALHGAFGLPLLVLNRASAKDVA